MLLIDTGGITALFLRTQSVDQSQSFALVVTLDCSSLQGRTSLHTWVLKRMAVKCFNNAGICWKALGTLTFRLCHWNHASESSLTQSRFDHRFAVSLSTPKPYSNQQWFNSTGQPWASYGRPSTQDPDCTDWQPIASHVRPSTQNLDCTDWAASSFSR